MKSNPTPGLASETGSERVKHVLKTWPVYWEAIYEGRKPFELRKEDDRKYSVGDQLILNHYDPEKDEYDGSWIEADVTYVLRGPAFGLNGGWVIMGIEVTKQIRCREDSSIDDGADFSEPLGEIQ